MLRRLRNALGHGMLGKLITCFYCLSMWVALWFVWFLKGDTFEGLVGWFALSGGAILLERITVQQSLELKIGEEESGCCGQRRLAC